MWYWRRSLGGDAQLPISAANAASGRGHLPGDVGGHQGILGIGLSKGADENRRCRQATKPSVIGGNHMPRCPFRTGVAEHLVEGLWVRFQCWRSRMSSVENFQFFAG